MNEVTMYTWGCAKSFTYMLNSHLLILSSSGKINRTRLYLFRLFFFSFSELLPEIQFLPDTMKNNQGAQVIVTLLNKNTCRFSAGCFASKKSSNAPKESSHYSSLSNTNVEDQKTWSLNFLKFSFILYFTPLSYPQNLLLTQKLSNFFPPSFSPIYTFLTVRFC